jgi:hypothetical protein
VTTEDAHGQDNANRFLASDRAGAMTATPWPTSPAVPSRRAGNGGRASLEQPCTPVERLTVNTPPPPPRQHQQRQLLAMDRSSTSTEAAAAADDGSPP